MRSTHAEPEQTSSGRHLRAGIALSQIWIRIKLCFSSYVQVRYKQFKAIKSVQSAHRPSGNHGDGDPVANPILTALLCSQRLETSGAHVSYIGNPEAPIANLSGDPKLLSSTAKLMSDPVTGIESLAYPVAQQFHYHTTNFAARPSERFDTFFNHLTWGPGAHVHESLPGANNADVLASAVEDLYQRYMVHVVDLDFRSIAPIIAQANARKRDTRNGLIAGTVVGYALRLKMSETSKIIL